MKHGNLGKSTVYLYDIKVYQYIMIKNATLRIKWRQNTSRHLFTLLIPLFFNGTWYILAHLCYAI